MIDILIITDDITEWVQKIKDNISNCNIRKQPSGYYFIYNELFNITIQSNENFNNRSREFSCIIIDKYIGSVTTELDLRPLLKHGLIETTKALEAEKIRRTFFYKHLLRRIKMKVITVKPIKKKDTKLTEQQKSIFHNRDIKICKELNISDKNDRWLFVGDTIRYCDQYGEYQGVLLYNPSYEEYGIFFGMWYGEDKYDSKSYGKFVSISLDNSDKMKIEKIMD